MASSDQTTDTPQHVRREEYGRLLLLARQRRAEADRLRKIAAETDAEATRISMLATDLAMEILANER